MVWFKVDDGLHSHPKALAAGTPALGLWVRCGSYSAQHLTEGFIPRAIADLYGTRGMCKQLVEAGLWIQVDGGYLMHDFLDRNPSREEVEKDRQAAADRQKRARDKARESRRDSRVTHAVSHGDVTGVVTVPPTRPDPTRPVVPTELLPDPSDQGTATADAVARATAPPRRARADTEPATFAEFYATYPIHKARSAAAKAYKRALTSATPEQILAGAQRFADDPTRDPAYTPHPATWLNQGRWADEGPARQAPRNSADQRTASHLALIERFTQPQLGA